MNHRYAEIWNRTEILLSRSLDELKQYLTQKETDLIFEFIEQREYGVALDILVGAIHEENIAISDVVRSSLKESAKIMGVTLKHDI